MQKPGLLFTLILDGQVIAGAWLSITVTVKEQVEVFPAASVALKVFVVVPIGKEAPLAAPTVCETVVPAQLSAPTGVE